MATIEINSADADKRLGKLEKLLTNATPLMRQIAAVLETETEHNFEAEGRPHWVPLAASTIEARQKRNRGSTVLKILQDRGILAASISSGYGPDFALIGVGGAATAYAGIHQFGGDVKHKAREGTLRHRTDAKGNLVRQADHPNLARFAKTSHKRVRETKVQIGAHIVHIPARPYLPFKGTATNAELQPEAVESVLETVTRFLGDAVD